MVEVIGGVTAAEVNPLVDYGVTVFMVGCLAYLGGKGMDIYCRLQSKKKNVGEEEIITFIKVFAESTKSLIENSNEISKSVVKSLAVINDRQIKTTGMVEETLVRIRDKG